MNSRQIEERQKKEKCRDNGPECDVQIPDANVGMEGQCLVPPHAESARSDTGEPCDDGREGVKN